MDMWKFFDIVHREHVICNPTSEAKLERLVGLLRLPAGARVVDIACGKGDFLIRLAEAYGIRGTGVDMSASFLAEAAEALKMRAPGGELVFTQMNGSDYTPDAPHSLDMASCIGASWVFGGHGETIKALLGMVKPGGWVIVGEPYWRQTPPEDYLKALDFGADSFASHGANAEAGEQLGAELVHTLVSSQDDWDRYEGLQWFSASEYARTHPDDPDVPELVERVSKERASFMRWGREALGWSIYLFRAPAAN